MTYGHPTTPADVLALIRDRLAVALGLTPSLAFLSLHPDDHWLRFPPADRFATVRPVSGQADQRGVAGGGRLTTAFDSLLRTAVFQRLDRDREGKARRGLTDPSVSLLGDLTRVVDVLQMFEPVRPDKATECLLREPMRVAGWQVWPKAGKDGNPWAVAECNWRFDFRLKLT